MYAYCERADAGSKLYTVVEYLFEKRARGWYCASGEVVVIYINTNPLLAIRVTIMIKGHHRACDNDTPAAVYVYCIYVCVSSCMR